MAVNDNPILWRKTTILDALETVYGTDAAPVGANALRIKDAEAVPFVAQTVDRGFVRSHLGASKRTHADIHRSIKYSCELAGSGAAGTAPGYDASIRCCGMASLVRPPANTIQNSPPSPQGAPAGAWTYVKGANHTGTVARTVTITCTTGGASGVARVTVAAPAVGGVGAHNAADVTVTDGAPLALPGGATITPTITTPLVAGDVWTIALAPALTQYRPVSEGFESTTSYFFKDGILYRARGRRGAATLTFARREVPKITFDTKALWSLPETQAPPVAAPAGFVDGLVFNKANTPTATLFGVPIIPTALEIKLGEAPAYRNAPNQEMVHLPNRDVTGSLTFQYPRLADLDVEALAQSDITGALQLVHGAEAGNIVQIDAAQVQMTEPKWSEDEGLTMCQVNLIFIPSDAGGDDVVLTIR